MIPIVDEAVRPAGVGTYGIGCAPALDTETMILTIGPGAMRLLIGEEEGTGLRDEFIFPGGEVTLPPETTEVFIGRRRSDQAPVILVNCAKGLDDVTFELVHVILRLGDAGWIQSYWRCTKADLRRWQQTKYKTPPDPEQWRGDPAEVVFVTDYPEHLKLSLARQKLALEATLRLGVLIRKEGIWTDAEKEQILRDLIISCPEVDLPPEMLDPIEL